MRAATLVTRKKVAMVHLFFLNPFSLGCCPGCLQVRERLGFLFFLEFPWLLHEESKEWRMGFGRACLDVKEGQLLVR